jgi:hypothetical protein
MQAEGGSKPSQLAIRDPDSSLAPPSSITILSPNLLFLGSWLGHSNLVVYEFQANNAAAESQLSPASKTPVPVSTPSEQTAEAAPVADGGMSQAGSEVVLGMASAAEALGVVLAFISLVHL